MCKFKFHKNWSLGILLTEALYRFPTITVFSINHGLCTAAPAFTSHHDATVGPVHYIAVRKVSSAAKEMGLPPRIHLTSRATGP